MQETLRAYYTLTKPGIIQGNAIHVLAGAFLASFLVVDWSSLLGVLFGTSFVIASACVVNNYMDRGMDAKMIRTKRRASVTGKISVRNGLLYAAVLLIIGFVILYAFTNILVITIGVTAYIMYVFVYGWAKRNSVHSTLIGAIPGALPALAGYVAITGSLSIAALLVFLLVFTWQMPHFYAISLFRKTEYAAAGVPVLGVVRSFAIVRRYICGYMLAYIAVIVLLITLRVVGPPAGLLLLVGGAYWVGVYALTKTNDQTKWARSVFGASLILTLLLLSASILNVFVPPLQ